MSSIYVDSIAIWKQRLLARLPVFLSFPVARKLLLKTSPAADSRDEYLATMRLEVIWLAEQYLKKYFIHAGTEFINQDETYIITSLHFGQWGMYPASLYQQAGISSQMVITGRNRRPDSPASYFWRRFGHLKQDLSGHPGRYSTDSFYLHARQLKKKISQIVILDVREHDLHLKELCLDFMGGPYYLPRTVPLLARRAKVRILPYIGYYDLRSNRHHITWFPPIEAKSEDRRTLQAILNLLEPIFAAHPDMYFNDLSAHRQAIG